MNTMRVYVAGPMTGLPELNFPAFHAAAAHLRAMGHTVINPAEINPDTSMAWHECMRADIAQLVTCNVIYLLPGWEDSKGAALEAHIAERLGMRIDCAPCDISQMRDGEIYARVSAAATRLTCDDCGAVTDDPWHASKCDNRHYHRCDVCQAIEAVGKQEPVGTVSDVDTEDGVVYAIVDLHSLVTCGDKLYLHPAQPFQPDWVNYRQGVEDGRAERQEAAQLQPLTQDQVDAERYRWLFNDVDLAVIKDALNNNRAPPVAFHSAVIEHIFGFYTDKAGADAVIDAAMKGASL